MTISIVSSDQLVIAVSAMRQGDPATARDQLPVICARLEEGYGEHPELARDFEDLLAWRDEVYATHRPGG